MKTKKGWIRIVEAFMAIVILLAFVMVLLSQMRDLEGEKSLVEKNNFKILKGIEINLSLRNEALSLSLPAYFNDSGPSSNFKKYLSNRTLIGENCFLYFCALNDSCKLQTEVLKEVYSSEIFLYANSTFYSPRKIKVFCYLK